MIVHKIIPYVTIMYRIQVQDTRLDTHNRKTPCSLLFWSNYTLYNTLQRQNYVLFIYKCSFNEISHEINADTLWNYKTSSEYKINQADMIKIWRDE